MQALRWAQLAATLVVQAASARVLCLSCMRLLGPSRDFVTSKDVREGEGEGEGTGEYEGCGSEVFGVSVAGELVLLKTPLDAQIGLAGSYRRASDPAECVAEGISTRAG